MGTTGRGVVIVSGGGAISPFTTPTEGCRSGLSAGSTDTGLREALLGAGLRVWTSPANVGRRPVTDDPEPNGFADAPLTLPAEMTVNSAGTIDAAGEHLARFLRFLADSEQLSELDLVCHSMGGLFARAALRELSAGGFPARVRSFTTLGTPWQGSFVAEAANGHCGMDVAASDPRTERIIHDFQLLIAGIDEGAGTQVVPRYLGGPEGWNERQGDVLRGIPVALVAGEWFTASGGTPHAWPHDGLVSRSSALADGLSPQILSDHERHVFPDVHSIYFSDQFELPWERALTWNPDVLHVVVDAISRA